MFKSNSPGPRWSELLRGVRVLVIDDDPGVLEALTDAVEFFGGMVVPVGSAASARRAVGLSRFDAILCDISMPGEDGCQFVAALRREEEVRGTGRIPVVAVTANGCELATLEEAGFQQVLRKPFEICDVGVVVASLVAK